MHNNISQNESVTSMSSLISKRKAKGMTLRFSLSTAFIITVLITTLLIAIISSLYTGNIIKQSIRMRLHDIAKLGSRQINGDLHNQIFAVGDENGKAYSELLKQLGEIKDINSDIKYAYTLREKSNGEIAFVVDSDPDLETRAPIGYRMEEVTPRMKAVFKYKKGTIVEKDYYTDEWGTFITGYASFYDSEGNFSGVLGLDISADTVRQQQFNNLMIILAVSILASLVTVLLSLILSKKIIKPITDVTKDMREIQLFNLNPTNISSRIFEIREMVSALDNMKKNLKSFKKYVPSEIVSDLVRSGKEAVLEAEKKEITIFFSDIADFTTISEKLPPDLLSQLLGEYLSATTHSIMASGGTVDKFIGDAIMALWGAPTELAGHPLAACQAALACQTKIKKWNEELIKNDLPPFHTRIGINTGEAIVGNMGYDERLSYTAIGDSVNLAARLEGLNKYYHTKIIISGTVYESVKEVMLAKFIDVVAVKGKEKGIRIYELIEVKEMCDAQTVLLVEKHNSAMENYLSRKWKAALTLFKELKKDHDNYLVNMMIDRCNAFIKKAPDSEWSGVVHLREK